MWAGRLLLAAYFAFALLILALRYIILPHIEDYRGDIEHLISASLDLPVAIGSIDAHWDGLHPWLALHQVQLHDRQHHPALTLDNIEAELSWASLLVFDIRLNRLELLAPTLNIRRDAAGHITVAGLSLDPRASTQDNALANWLLAQRRIIIRDARIEWLDQWRQAPSLTLERVNLLVQNNGRRHRFGLTAVPPIELASHLDLRGDFRGDNISDLTHWQGEAYAELEYANLAAWQQWLDYPVKLSRGSGGLRLWVTRTANQSDTLTADIALQDVDLHLDRTQAPFRLQSLTGRLSGQRLASGYAVSARRLSLRLHDGLQIEPTDFDFHWNEAGTGRPANGSFNASRLDFDTLARLAGRLPLDASSRQQLVDYAPRGTLSGLKASWTLQPGSEHASAPILDKYTISAQFSRLSLNAQGALPGFTGLSGSINGDERGGSFQLDSQDAALGLPEIFADPRIELGRLTAQARWQTDEQAVTVMLQEARFDNQDAAGSVSGHYTYPRSGQTAGVIDLAARLTRGQGNAVWRYIPLVAGQEVRDWLRTSIIGGHSQDTTLRLKGDLQHFPFDDGSGIFEVKGHVQGANLNYADGWPQINDIQGALEFVGKRMRITAERAHIYGVTLRDVRAEIPDLGAADTQLLISGKAAGPTADFLQFIEASPVGAQIGHFTEDMRAQGNGQLDLKLQLPLNRLADTRIDGRYQFNGNRLLVAPDLPALNEVQGRLQFTGDALKAERIQATLLGMPLAFDLKTAGNGNVRINADGRLNVADLRQQWTHPLLDRLSGSAAWQGTVLARKKSAEIIFESTLQGLASTLPEPFSKLAEASLPLRIERRQRNAAVATALAASAAAVGDQLDLHLGELLSIRLLRRQKPGRAERGLSVERGAMTIGSMSAAGAAGAAGILPKMPDKGVALAVNLPALDLDLWRSLLQPAARDTATNHDPDDGTNARASALPLTSLNLKTPLLTLQGYRIADLAARATLGSDGIWRSELKSRDINGELSWKGQGSGRLTAHLKQLTLHRDKPATPQAAELPSAHNQANTPTGKLPGLDIEVDRLILQGKEFGKLKLSADQRNSTWEASFDIDNPDAHLSGTGQWHPDDSRPETRLKFALDARSIEKLLTRLGYADAVKRGSAQLEGQLAWQGPPYSLDDASLTGEFKVHAENGQFNKLEPGVGRLLGILSLQSLPRRITLDFRDVFSQGFAFDRIDGQLVLNQGVISTQALKIQGPAAKVLMSGSASVPQETQNLTVRVQPAIGESLAVGAMIAHPAAGALAWLAQKVMQDPLDQAFAFEYAVTGRWEDPKVEKLATPLPLPIQGNRPERKN